MHYGNHFHFVMENSVHHPVVADYHFPDVIILRLGYRPARHWELAKP